jgi:hypothetical protein
MKPPARERLQATGVVEVIGAESFYPTVRAAGAYRLERVAADRCPLLM